jgi:hypothetical protein
MKNIIFIYLMIQLFCASISRVNLILQSRLMHAKIMVSSLVAKLQLADLKPVTKKKIRSNDKRT